MRKPPQSQPLLEPTGTFLPEVSPWNHRVRHVGAPLPPSVRLPREVAFAQLLAPDGHCLWEEDHSLVDDTLAAWNLHRFRDLEHHLHEHPEHVELLMQRARRIKSCPARGSGCPPDRATACTTPWTCLLDHQAAPLFLELLRSRMEGDGHLRARLTRACPEGGTRPMLLAAEGSATPGHVLLSLTELPQPTRRGRFKTALAHLLSEAWEARSAQDHLLALHQAFATCGLPPEFMAMVRDGRRSRIWVWTTPQSRYRQDCPDRIEALERATRTLAALQGPTEAGIWPLGSGQQRLGVIVLDPPEASGPFNAPEDRQNFRLLCEICGHLMQATLTSVGLARSQAMLLQTQAMSNLGTLEVDVDEKASHWSPMARELWGLLPDDTQPGYANLLARVDPEDRPSLRNAVQQWRHGLSDLQGRFRIRIPSGGVRWLATLGRLELGPDGRPRRYFLTFQDVTTNALDEQSRREREELYRMLAEENARLLERSRQEAGIKSMLLQEVNHRVKNNLMGILGMLELEQRAAVARSGAFMANLEDLKQRIFALSRVHELLSAEAWEPIRLDRLVEDIVRNTLAGSPVAQRVELKLAFEDPALRVQAGTATPLAMILAELTTNSVKYAFAFRRTGLLSIQVGQDPEDGRVSLIFHDDGPGFPDDVLTGSSFHVGLKLIKIHIRNLPSGSLTMDNAPGARTWLRFSLPPLPVAHA